jgi:hypothetical protein
MSNKHHGDQVTVLVLMFVGFVFIPLHGSPLRQWPVIEPVEQTVSLNLPDIDDPKRSEYTSGKQTIDVTIKSLQGDPVYKIECGTPDRSSAQTFEYSGDFQCRMILWGSETSAIDLLSEIPNSTHDWQSRARFFASEVLGSCGAIPELGRVRNFRLRGMKVTLAMSEIKPDTSGKVPTLRSFTFRVDVESDSTEQSSIALAPTTDPKWRATSCSLDDSVPAHFGR